MKLKKTIAIGFAATALFASFGCGGGGKQGGSSPAASAVTQQSKDLDEATIKNLLKKLESSNIQDKQEVCPLEKLPGYALYKTPLNDVQSKLQNEYYNRSLKFSNLSVADIKKDGDFASARLSYTTAENKLNTEILHFARIDGKWCVEPTGFKAVKSLKVAADDERIEAAANLGYTYENVPVIVLDVRSKTATRYKASWANPATFLLITDAGEFPTQNVGNFVAPMHSIAVSSAEPTRFCLPFKGASGKPQALRVIGFNELSDRGLPLDMNGSQVVTFTFSE